MAPRSWQKDCRYARHAFATDTPSASSAETVHEEISKVLIGILSRCPRLHFDTVQSTLRVSDNKVVTTSTRWPLDFHFNTDDVHLLALQEISKFPGARCSGRRDPARADKCSVGRAVA